MRQFHVQLSAKWAMIMTVIFFTLPVNIGIALWIGELTGKSYYGFIAILSFYALFVTVLYLVKNHQKIRHSAKNSIDSFSKRKQKDKSHQWAS